MLSRHYNPVSAQDYIPRPLLRQVQLQRLQKIVAHEYSNVEFYRRRMDEKGVKPSDIRSLEDIAKLPFMMKKDLRDTYPFGLFALDILHNLGKAPRKQFFRLGVGDSDVELFFHAEEEFGGLQ